MDVSDLVEPIKLYENLLKGQFQEASSSYFDELVKKSGVNPEDNALTVKKYRDNKAKGDSFKKTISGLKCGKAFSIVGIVLFGILLGLGIVFLAANATVPMGLKIGFLVGGILGVALMIFLLAGVISPKLKKAKQEQDGFYGIANQAKQDGYVQLAPLNALYNPLQGIELVEKVFPFIKFNRILTNPILDYVKEKYSYELNEDENCSSVQALSGTFVDAPFVYERNKVMTMGTQTYHGELVIHWTTTSTDSKGHTTVIHHTQTLNATVSKPAAFYSYDVSLNYYNDAAEKVSFSRKPSKVDVTNQKSIDKAVKSCVKEMDKLAEKSLTFTRLGNDEFETLFHALDRDNEVDFRLMYTPLAQKATLDLLKSVKPYGDDFHYWKKGTRNVISSSHSQSLWFFPGNGNFEHFALDSATENFNNYYLNFFTKIYFDFAPLMAVPLFAQTKPSFYEIKDPFGSNFSPIEHECLANLFSKEDLAHEETKTDFIVKATYQGKANDRDLIKLVTRSFDKQERIDYVPTLGGDGHMHNVPVIWYEYIPLERTRMMEVKEFKGGYDEWRSNPSTETIFNSDTHCGIVFERGMCASLLKE